MTASVIVARSAPRRPGRTKGAGVGGGGGRRGRHAGRETAQLSATGSSRRQPPYGHQVCSRIRAGPAARRGPSPAWVRGPGPNTRRQAQTGAKALKRTHGRGGRRTAVLEGDGPVGRRGWGCVGRERSGHIKVRGSRGKAATALERRVRGRRPRGRRKGIVALFARAFALAPKRSLAMATL